MDPISCSNDAPEFVGVRAYHKLTMGRSSTPWGGCHVMVILKVGAVCADLNWYLIRIWIWIFKYHHLLRNIYFNCVDIVILKSSKFRIGCVNMCYGFCRLGSLAAAGTVQGGPRTWIKWTLVTAWLWWVDRASESESPRWSHLEGTIVFVIEYVNMSKPCTTVPLKVVFLAWL